MKPNLNAINAYTYLKSEINDNLQKLQELSQNNFGLDLKDIDIHDCNIINKLGIRLRNISECIQYAEFTDCFATDAYATRRSRLVLLGAPIKHETPKIAFNRYKDQFDNSINYLLTTIINHFDVLGSNKINFNHCADMAFYNTLLNEVIDLAFTNHPNNKELL